MPRAPAPVDLPLKSWAGVLDDQTDAGVARKVDSQLDLSHVAHIDRVAAVTTNCAVARGVVSRQTGSALVQWPHNRCGISSTAQSARDHCWNDRTYCMYELVQCDLTVSHSAASYSGHEE
jgi:hypothetical protein